MIADRPLSIVVCDDNIDIADSLTLILSGLGYRVMTAYSGRDAVAATERAMPDVALLDIGMPDLDGYEVARRIRAMPTGSGIKLFAVTGYGSAADKQKASEAGFNMHFTKPVNLPALESILGAVV